LTKKKLDHKKPDKDTKKVSFDDLVEALLEVPKKPNPKKGKRPKKDA